MLFDIGIRLTLLIYDCIYFKTRMFLMFFQNNLPRKLFYLICTGFVSIESRSQLICVRPYQLLTKPEMQENVIVHGTFKLHNSSRNSRFIVGTQVLSVYHISWIIFSFVCSVTVGRTACFDIRCTSIGFFRRSIVIRAALPRNICTGVFV